MRPIHLAMQAFGPFAELTRLDLRDLEGHHLFGIFGPTGGGKTSVLDAICFALFGVSSGGEREMADLRSHHAPPEALTFVELVFALGKRRYFLRREPTQELPAKRGEGMVTHAHAAWLFDVSDLPIDDISFPENPGRVLAEKKVVGVNAEIHRLLGYTDKQFRQILVLPQGDFRTFLTAPGRERSGILRKLFDTAIFERFTEELKARRRQLNKQLEASRTAMETVLEGIALAPQPVTSLAVLEELIAQWEQQCRQGEADLKDNEIRQHAAAAALAEAEKAAAAFHEHEAAAATLTTLSKRDAEIATLRAQLEAATRASQLDADASALARADSELRDSHRQVTRLDAELHAARQTYRQAVAAYETSQARAASRERLAAKLAELERAAQTLAALANKRATLMHLQAETRQAEQQFRAAQNTRKAAEEKLADLQDKNAQLATEKARHARLALDHARAQAQHKIQQKLTQKEQEREATTQALAQSRAEVAQAEKDLQAAEQALARAEQHAHSSAAALLAAQLAPDTPCPVCGSLHHPSPAKAKTSPKGPARPPDLPALRSRRQQAQDTLQALRLQQAGLESRQSQLAEDCANLLSELDEAIPLVEWARRCARLAQKLAQSQALLATEPGLQEALRQARQQLAHATQAFETARRALESKKAAKLALETEINTRLADIPAPLRDPRQLTQAQDEMRTKLTQETRDHEAAETARNQARETLKIARARLADARNQARHRQDLYERAEKHFTQALAAQGFASRPAFEAARLPASERQKRAKEIETHNRAVAEASARLARATEAIHGLTRPDLPALREALASAEQAAHGAREALTTRRTELEALRNARQLYLERRTAYQKTEKEFRNIATLAEIADGRGLNSQRISLVDWVLGAYFDDVLAAANLRFERMSRGRYELRRKQAPTTKRASSGLDIVVFDSFTGQERPARTLSGGESFLAALALALGLSDVVQAESGGVRLEAIFIDEGFGQLDEEALEQALGTLVSLAGSARMIGLISHVEEIKQLVPAGYDITRGPLGSQITPRQ